MSIYQTDWRSRRANCYPKSKLVAASLLLIASGCVGIAYDSQGPSAAQRLTALVLKGGPIRKAIGSVTPQDDSSEPIRWDWATAIPTGVPRGETIPAAIAPDYLAELVPEASQEVVQASTQQGSDVLITNAGGKPIGNYAQLHQALEESIATDSGLQLEMRTENQNAKPISVELDAATAQSLDQAFTGAYPIMRVVDDGNPWVVFNDAGVRCKVMVRGERTRGLVHVVMSLRATDGPQRQLPLDVRADFQNRQMPCLSVAEVLDALYTDRQPQSNKQPIQTFASISERDEYCAPTNYRRLEEAFLTTHRHPLVMTAPAFLSATNASYPGSPILGDARALSTFLMQPQLMRPGDPASIGWLVFASDSAHRGGTVRLDIDLGNGPNRLEFTLPPP